MTTRNNHCMKSSAAFTLTELLVVIAIIMILVTMATFALVNLAKSHNMVSAISQVSSYIELSRQHAITSGRPVRFCIVMDTNNGLKPLQTFTAYEGVITNDAGTIKTNWVSYKDSTGAEKSCQIMKAQFLPVDVYFDVTNRIEVGGSATNVVQFKNGENWLASFSNAVTKTVDGYNYLCFFEFDIDGSLSMPNADDNIMTLDVSLLSAAKLDLGGFFSDPCDPGNFQGARTNLSSVIRVSTLTGRGRVVRVE